MAVLPLVSQRYAIRATELLTGTSAENAGKYDQQIRAMLDNLKGGFTPDAVNIVMTHLTVTGGAKGGGERDAQSIFEYYVPAHAFGAEPHYVALGHLHRHQSIPASCPVYYSGSPIAVDFGEEENENVVLSVEVTPTTPATVTAVPMTQGRRLRTVRGTVAELLARATEFGDDYLRVYVCAKPCRTARGDPGVFAQRAADPHRPRVRGTGAHTAGQRQRGRRSLAGRTVRGLLRRTHGRRRRRPSPVRPPARRGEGRRQRTRIAMRPILLEMNGFASFREETRVSFADVEHFTLVRRTGAGKSAVIDAMTFALYGTVPRWDHEAILSPALAPTTNRGPYG
ncbi:AAA family ATPase [Actinophytocola sp.]|uniref:AAA family ATPase n=1 Tax=Actinophytocola sp. TaxID=1872138 RepID=UPI00389AE5B3